MVERDSKNHIRFIEDKSKGIVTVILSDAEPVRSVRGKVDPRVLHYYGADGELVRLDLDDKPAPGAGRLARKWNVPPDTPVMTLKYTAEVLGMHPSSVRRLAARGALRAERLGSEWITTVPWVEEYQAKRRGPGRPRRSA